MKKKKGLNYQKALRVFIQPTKVDFWGAQPHNVTKYCGQMKGKKVYHSRLTVLK